MGHERLSRVAQSWSALPQSGDIRCRSGLTCHDGPPVPTSSFARRIVGVPSYGRLWSQRGWLVGNGVGCISVTNPEAHLEARVALCSLKSGGDGGV
jgi:hypothetical protein